METRKVYLPPKVSVTTINMESGILTGSLEDWAVQEIPGENFTDNSLLFLP